MPCCAAQWQRCCHCTAAHYLGLTPAVLLVPRPRAGPGWRVEPRPAVQGASGPPRGGQAAGEVQEVSGAGGAACWHDARRRVSSWSHGAPACVARWLAACVCTGATQATAVRLLHPTVASELVYMLPICHIVSTVHNNPDHLLILWLIRACCCLACLQPGRPGQGPRGGTGQWRHGGGARRD